MVYHQSYAVSGMHCASCEAIIEKKLLGLYGVCDARASTAKGTVTIAVEGTPPTDRMLNRLFPEGLYTFSSATAPISRRQEAFRALGYGAAAVAIFLGLSSSGFLRPLAIDSSSSFGTLFLFGLLAGLSGCAALVGGLVLALSSQWIDVSGKTGKIGDRLKPQVIFNAGRILAYALAGALLGQLGESARITPGITSITTGAVSIIMIVLAFQMLGFAPFSTIRIALPKRLVRLAGRGFSKGGLLRPFPSGLMTILLPCGFTMAAEGVAVLSGTPWRGMAVMTSFVLGTTLPLLAIGLSSATFVNHPWRSGLIMKSAGMLVIFLAAYNLDSQFSFAVRPGSPLPAASPARPSGGRIIRTTYSTAGDIAPANFTVRRGESVRFIVDPKESASGCMSTIMIPGLWNRSEELVKGKSVVMEFTPKKTGTYRITCAMGVPRGTITVM